MIALADLTDPAAVEAHVDEVAERFGRLDTLIHNAAERADGQFESIAFLKNGGGSLPASWIAHALFGRHH